jgi:DNA-binding NtrC family response regulator
MVARGRTEERTIRVLLIDPSLELSGRLEQALAPYQSTLIFAYSPATMLRALSSTSRFELIVVNVSDDVLQWNLVGTLHQFGREPAIIACYDPSDPDTVEPFSSLPHCQCIARTAEPDQTIAMIRRAASQILVPQPAPSGLSATQPGRLSFSETIVGKSKKMLDHHLVISERFVVGSVLADRKGRAG